MPKLSDVFIRQVPADRISREYRDRGFPAGSLSLLVTPRGRKTFYLRYRVGSRQRRLKIGRYPALSLAAARRKALACMREVEAAGTDPAEEKKTRRGEETFAQTADLYIRRHAMMAKSAKSLYEDRRMIARDLGPAWGSRKIGEIGKKDVIALLDHIRYGRNAPVAANRTRALIAKIFSWAISRDLVSVNPVSGIRPAAERARDRVLSDAEIKCAWEKTALLGEPWTSLFRLILLTGQRPGEVRALGRDQLEGDDVTAAGGLIWTIPGVTAKNRREHKIPLAPAAGRIVRGLAEASGTGYLFPSIREGRGHVRTLQRPLARLRAACGFEFTAHDLRRTAATGLARFASADVVARILNHAWVDRTMTAVYDRYDRMAEMRIAVEGWAGALEHIVSGQTARIISMRGGRGK